MATLAAASYHQHLHLETVASQEIREVLKRKDIDAVLCSQNRSTRVDDDPEGLF